MNFQQGDILMRKTEGTQTLWLSERLVVEVCGISEKYLTEVVRTRYKKSVRACDLAKAKEFLPDSGKAWRWAKTQGQFYYCLENIPNKAPQCYRDRFGDAQALWQNYENALQNTQETALENMFKQHLNKSFPQYLEYYSQVDATRRVALAKACGVLDFLLENAQSYGGTKYALFKDLSPILKKMDLAYIPHNPIRLKEKFDLLMGTEQSIIELVELPRVGNKNAEQYNDPEVFSWVMQLRASGGNFSNEFIIREIWKHCDRTGKEKPSRRWFGQSIFEQTKTQFLTAEKRFGIGSRKAQMYSGYIPMKNAIDAGDCWEIDATRMNILAHQTQDEKGNKAEKFLFVIAVRDVYSGDVLGYDFAYSENHSAYLRALRMAVEETGYLPYSLTCDRFPGHNTDEAKTFFERLKMLGVQVNVTHNPQGKAKIERWFGTLQSVVLMGSQYYYGEGIQSRRLSAHRSSEFLSELKKQAKKDQFDYIKAYKECEAMIEQWRELPYCTYSRKYGHLLQSPKQLHQEAVKRNVIEVDEAKVSMLFHRRKEITLKNNGLITTEIDKVSFHYQIAIENYEVIANYTGKKVVMTYDVFASDKVYLWEKHGHLLTLLCTAQLFEAVQGHGPTAELGRISEGRAREQKIKQRKEQELQELLQLAEEDLLMGKFSDKQKVSKAEENYLQTPVFQPKKVANSDTCDEINISVRRMY